MLYTHSTPVNDNKTIGLSKDSGEARVEKILMPDDKISVSVWNHDELSVGSVHNVYNVQEDMGKWVMLDSKGEVNLPQIGQVKLQGLTVREAKLLLEKMYGKYVQNPILNIRLLNNQVTVLGEVRSPGMYVFSSDNVRLSDLIGKAQGFTDFARTTKIRIIRNNETLKADLTNTEYTSVIILPGDVIYIPPTGGKSWDRFATRLIPVASLLTAIALVYNVSQQD